MRLNPAARGLRRAELITADPLASMTFHEALLGWVPMQTETGFDCWIGNRRCASVRGRKAGRRPRSGSCSPGAVTTGR
ncbi:hypothetical protein ACFQ0O_10045 [Saccharopolyspora spinosporotrichia]